MRTRPARAEDAAAIAAIYNEGIEDRLATFETGRRSADDVARWVGAFPVVVAEDEAGLVAAWASAAPSSGREAYAGVREFSIYVARSHRGRGFGRAALAALVAESEARGFWKLVGRVFPENETSLALCRSLGFREVGVHRRHARLDGEWRDVVVVEKLLGQMSEPTSPGSDPGHVRVSETTTWPEAAGCRVSKRTLVRSRHASSGRVRGQTPAMSEPVIASRPRAQALRARPRRRRRRGCDRHTARRAGGARGPT